MGIKIDKIPDEVQRKHAARAATMTGKIKAFEKAKVKKAEKIEKERLEKPGLFDKLLDILIKEKSAKIN